MEYVVILHGILFGSFHMWAMANYLQKQGYEVVNINYPSRQLPLNELIDYVMTEVDKRTPDKTRQVNFVGYSMGGLIIRGVLAKYRPVHLGRVVMLAPPNHGSEVADFLTHIILYKWICGPAGQQLTTDKVDNLDLFGPVDYDLGIIAGNATFSPISSGLLLPGENDGKVTVASTRLEGMKEHIVIAATHALFPFSREAQRLTLQFLKTGYFKPMPHSCV